MLRIITHIEQLLGVHDCVILPTLGGFVLQSVPAIYDEKENMFRPMHKEVMFNATLRHTDGLLSDSYMRMYGVDYQKAQWMLEEDIEALSLALQQEKHIILGRIGSFSLGQEGQIIFTPGDSGVFNADSYGLRAFNFPVLPHEEEQIHTDPLARKQQKDVFYIPVSRKLIRLVAASAAAVVLFFLVSTPVKEVSQSAYTASFVPTEMIHYYMEEPTEETEIQASAPEEATNTEAIPMEAAAAVKKETATEVKEETPPTPQPTASAQKMYHVVIASFPTKAQADEFIQGVDRTQCAHVNTIARNGKYRVYADRFDNRADAEAYQTNLRKIDTYKNAWLFISR